MDIIMTKWAGLKGSLEIVDKKRDELLGYFPARFIDSFDALRIYTDTKSDIEIAQAFAGDTGKSFIAFNKECDFCAPGYLLCASFYGKC